MPEKSKVLQIAWDASTTYQFHCFQQTRVMYDEGGRKNRCKNVFRGYFIDNAPAGVEPNVICWLKQVRIDEKCKYPQLREQFDMADFPESETPHIRHLLARNPEAERIVQEVRLGRFPKVGGDCFMVERCYSELFPDQIQYLTPWERLEYMSQFCIALQELYETSKSVYNWPVAAHRDVKIGNGLILRDKNRFRVILLDFSSVRFESDLAHAKIPDTYRPEYISSKGGQGTDPYLMSHENTCLEIVCSGYDTTQATDVYALGTMLASLFGYVTPTCRNPNVYCCTNPSPQGSDMRISMERPDLEAHLLKWLPRDKKLGRTYRGTSWVEQMLEQAHTPFTWGDPKGAPYQLPRDLLDQVRELFFQATRLDPNDRISMDEFRKCIQTLKNATPKERGSSPKLYMSPECVYMIHQDGLREHKTLLVNAVSKSLTRPDSNLPVQLCWYKNPEQKKTRPRPDDTEDTFAPIATAKGVLTKIQVRLASTPVQSTSLVRALYELWNNYHTYQYENRFSGTIHIFSLEPFNRGAFRPIIIDGQRFTFNDFLQYLFELSDGELQVRFHSPYKLEPRDHHPSFKRVLLPVLEEEPQKTRSEPRPEPKPEPAPQPEPPKQEEVPEQEVDMTKFYLLGFEGLFFLDEDERKVYVTRRKIRR